jgi:hypothetical protein
LRIVRERAHPGDMKKTMSSTAPSFVERPLAACVTVDDRAVLALVLVRAVREGGSSKKISIFSTG